MSIQVCKDTSDAVALYLPQRLYLKPYAKINISVQLSQKVHGKAISTWEIMEKLRKIVHPDTLSVLKVSKHSADVIRFDAELEDKNKLDSVIARLEDRILQLTDYPDPLRVKVSEAKSDYPSRHSWDAFFRDTTDMDEMKPGERPDTVHISNLPIRWFVHNKERDSDAPPSENIFKKVFEKFGSIRQIDIPAADPFRMQMKSALRGITIPLQEASSYFEGYVQFNEYVSFVRCMDVLRGQKLLRKKDELSEWCSIKVDFDKTKHMTDAAVKRRGIVREKLLARQRTKEGEEKAEMERLAKLEAKERHKVERAELEKLDKMRQREERRKKKQLVKLMEKDNLDINGAVAEEERKLLKVQMKLQSLRLAEELFKRIELHPQESRRNGTRPERYFRTGEMAARGRIIERQKREQEELLEKQRDRLKLALEGRIVIKTALEHKRPPRCDSISSLSSEDERVVHKRIKTEKLTTPERETEYKKTLGMFGMHPSFGYGYPFATCPPAFPAPYPQPSMYYPGVQGAYYPPPAEYVPRRPYMRRGRGRGLNRGNGRHYSNSYDNGHIEHDDRHRTRSRSRGRSYTRSRSRSRSRGRSYTRSRSRSRRSRSRSRRRSYTRSRSKSRGRRSRSHHGRSRSRSRSRSHKKSNNRRSRTKSRSKSKHRTPPKENEHTRASVDSSKFVSPNRMRQKTRSRSWSLPKDGKDKEKHRSKSPKDQ